MRLWEMPSGQTPEGGQYLRDFDFEAHNGRGEITLTRDAAEAMRFPDSAAAFAYYRRSPECRPIRADGKPNRPLTATNWEFLDAPESQAPGDRPAQSQGVR